MSRKFQFALVFLLLGLLSSATRSGFAQTNALNFGNNFFVTGDYVVGGVGLRGLGDSSGFAKGTINIPDQSPAGYISGARKVPPGAQIVSALLYWETVESSSTVNIGANGFFRPVFTGGPATGYPITGTSLGSPNAPPVAWSSGGCSGGGGGQKIIQAYRADVRPYLQQDANGNLYSTYEVRLRDSGSGGNGVPLTLGATLVIIFRVLSPNIPLNAIVIYDGASSSSNANSTMSQTVQGFYQPDAAHVARLTHIVGNGSFNKYEQVFFANSLAFNAVGTAAFPGQYNGSWDNPTWDVSKYVSTTDTSETTSVVPNQSGGGCETWGAVIMSTTVQDTDGDGLLDVWEDNHGYCDASVNGGVCSNTDASWVPLPGACSGGPNQPGTCPADPKNTRDVFVQLDYMCSIVNLDGTCNTALGYSFDPFLTVDPVDGKNAVQKVVDAFANSANHPPINLHVIRTHAIQEQTFGSGATDCTDSFGNPALCGYPNQPGVVAWKWGFTALKNQLVLPNGDPSTCTTSPPPANCAPRFQHGRKDSYHYALFGHALGLSKWSLSGGTLTSVAVEADGSTVTFTTSTSHGLVVDSVKGNGRVNVVGAITNANLNGTFVVTGVNDAPNPPPYTFKIKVGGNPLTPGTLYTVSTDPVLSVDSGQTGTRAGFSDIGGQDSSIALGLWGADGQTWQVQTGVFMHELGHSLALTHGGFYYDTAGSYFPTLEANCKPNFQSVMNYMFGVDLLVDPADPTKSVPDYSEQQLDLLNESITTSSNPFTTVAPLYPTTSWYIPWSGVGTPAKLHCDGTPILDNAQMVRTSGPTGSLSWTVPPPQDINDINFDGNTPEALRGHSDWTSASPAVPGIDPRQVAATGSMSVAGGFGGANGGFGGANGGFGGANGGFGGANGGFGGANGGFGGANGGFGGANGGFGGANGGGPDRDEITHETANSVTRPPRSLTAVVVTTTPPAPYVPPYAHLSWMVPTFGQVTYNVYRSDNPKTPIATGVAGTTYDDHTAVCGPAYTYSVTAVLIGTNQESVATYPPPNQQGLLVCAPPYAFTGFLAPLSAVTAPGGVTPLQETSYSGTFLIGNPLNVIWTLTDNLGHAVPYLNVNTLLAIGPVPPQPNGACQTPSTVKVFFNYGKNYPYAVTTLSPQGGFQAPNTFTSNSPTDPTQFTFTWATTLQTVAAGCYVIELDLDSGQVERTALKLAAPYIFTGFFPKLATADPPNAGSYSGAFSLRSSVTTKWELQNSDLSVVSNLNANTLLAIGPIPVPKSGKCPDSLAPVFYQSPPPYSCGPNCVVQTLFSPKQAAKGGSTFKFSTPQFVFNWNTTTNTVTNAPLQPGCYVIELDLDTGQVERTGLQF